MIVTKETKIRSTTVLLHEKMPKSGTVIEIARAAKKIYRKYHSTTAATYYGGATQIEVRCVRDGYHGRDLKLVATYEIVPD